MCKLSDLFISIIVCGILASCGQTSFTHSHEFPSEIWQLKDTFKFQQNATQGQVKLGMTGIYTDDYPFQNLYVKCSWKSPSGKVQDTLVLDTLSDVLGKWKTDGSAPYQIPFQKVLQLPAPENGNYEIKIWQYMRTDSLRGIRKLGVNVLK